MGELKESNFLPPQTYPWLAITEDGVESTAFYSLSQEKILSKRRIVPPGHRILTSSRGWLLLMDTRSSLCHLSNIHSGAKIQLPAEPFTYRRTCNLLYFSDDDHHRAPSRVIHVHPGGIWFCDPGAEQFVKSDLVPNSCETVIGAAIRRGELYLAGEVMPEPGGFNARVLMRFDFDSLTTTEVTRFDFIEHSIIYGYKVQLFESAGELFLVYRMYCQTEPVLQQLCTFVIKQYRFESNQMIELRDIGERTLFLGQAGGYYETNDSVLCGPITGEPGIDPNSIYYLEPDDKFLRVYSLVDDSLLMTLPNPEVKASSNVSLDWIML